MAVVAAAGCEGEVVAPAEPTSQAPAQPREVSHTPPPEPSAPATYEGFKEVDPYTSAYFIALEDTDLADTQGEERLYNLGRNVCLRLDDGKSFAGQVEGLAVEAGLGDDGGAVVASAVLNICPHHEPLMRDWIAENGG